MRTWLWSLEPEDIAVFVVDLRTFRDRAVTLLTLLGGLRAAEVRSLRLANVDMGMRRLRVAGKGVKGRVVPVGRRVLHRAGRLPPRGTDRCRLAVSGLRITRIR